MAGKNPVEEQRLIKEQLDRQDAWERTERARREGKLVISIPVPGGRRITFVPFGGDGSYRR